MSLALRVLSSCVTALFLAFAASQANATQFLGEFVERCVLPLKSRDGARLDGLFRFETVPHEVAVRLRDNGVDVPSMWVPATDSWRLFVGTERGRVRCQFTSLPELPSFEEMAAVSDLEWCLIESADAEWAAVLKARDENGFAVMVIGIESNGSASLAASWTITPECSDA
ncbi:MAG: hypothetical protein AAGF13_06895 [Pseudomonadota bacterium]